MRGAQNENYGLNYLDRIIPADAGSTPVYAAPDFRVWDHPRGCGEHVCVWFHSANCEGSSPRMRGALYLVTLIGS